MEVYHDITMFYPQSHSGNKVQFWSLYFHKVRRSKLVAVMSKYGLIDVVAWPRTEPPVSEREVRSMGPVTNYSNVPLRDGAVLIALGEDQTTDDDDDEVGQSCP